mgnify:CR=1 FL=1
MKHQLKGAWVLISGENVGWPVDRSAKGDSLRAAIKAENIEIEKQNCCLDGRELEQRNQTCHEAFA